MQPGSRLLVLVDAIKIPAQVNYGTGKDVSDESIKDAGDPLKIEIRSGSYSEVPLDNSSDEAGQSRSQALSAPDCSRAPIRSGALVLCARRSTGRSSPSMLRTGRVCPGSASTLS
jgi:hypothetical protein